jgi:hypothetical protein
LTAQFESGEVAKEMLQAYADDHTTKVINEKPDPEDLPNTDGAVTPAKDVEVTPRQAIAAAATREFANRQPVSG